MRCLGCGGQARVIDVRSGTQDGHRVCRRITVCESVPGCPPDERRRAQLICDEGPTRRRKIPPEMATGCHKAPHKIVESAQAIRVGVPQHSPRTGRR